MPTIRRCCIVGCLSNSRQNPHQQFFQFPKPENPFHKVWKQACHASLSRILPFKKPVVCALHFHPTSIGGRRLTASAVPSIGLEVPSNLKAVEQQAMMEEIERSRKCAYINAVVYEWLVRANLNPQLRGSITHGMIKEKADTAKQVIGSSIFVADNRWLNRFRETHLTGFAQKLATNQLKPLGPSLWVPDIVQELQHLFPPTCADRSGNFENVPEQYMNYMQQYGEYEEDDDMDQKYHEQSAYYQQQQQQQSQHTVFGAYGQSNNFVYDYMTHERSYTAPQQQLQLPRQDARSSPQRLTTPPTRASPLPIKRQKLQDDGAGGGTTPIASRTANGRIEDLTVEPEVEPSNGNDNGGTTANGAARSSSASSNSSSLRGHSNGKAMLALPTTTTNGRSNNSTPNGHATPTGKASNGHATNGHAQLSSKELESYSQAIEYLKPLEDFALFKENFRAIGLISQLEVILRKGERIVAAKADN